MKIFSKGGDDGYKTVKLLTYCGRFREAGWKSCESATIKNLFSVKVLSLTNNK